MTTIQPIVFNPLDPAFRADPYPLYRRLLAEDPVHMTILGVPAFSRHADCIQILKDHKRFSSDNTRAAGYDPQALPQMEGVSEGDRPFLFFDPPDHTRLRRLVNMAFSAKAVEALRPRVQEIVDELLDAVAKKGEMDAIADLAYPLPVAVICEMLGVPKEDQPQFAEWSEVLVQSLDPDLLPPSNEVLERRAWAIRESRSYFRALVAERRKSPGSDILSGLIAAEDEGDKLTEAELLSTCSLLLVAGHETTVNLIGNGIFRLLQRPEQLAKFKASWDLAPKVVEEVLRFDPPVQFDGRICVEQAEVGGFTVQPGQFVLLLIGAANRDPAVFPDEPDTFDVTRDATGHIAFGYGIHFCLGAPLARIEGQIALRTLFQRFPNLHRTTEGFPPYRPQITLRGISSLPLAW
jgi:cytochrome P450